MKFLSAFIKDQKVHFSETSPAGDVACFRERDRKTPFLNAQIFAAEH